ncbi:MAG: glycosyl transferase family 9 [Bacteroidetes bacterium]|nr:glycosyl transferase family 9 [Bacteroidota bacterium]
MISIFEFIMKILFLQIILLYYRIEFVLLKIIPFANEKSILLTRLDNIGDFILWLDSAKEYKKHCKCKIVLLCNNSCYEIAKVLPYFDDLIPVNTKKLIFNLLYRIKIFYPICKRKFQKIINPTFLRDYFFQESNFISKDLEYILSKQD